ncbi:MAG TPA: D-sedoheptulose 7-phosphate isomerase [Elusimicrobiota bacterium]|jgi:D-sedoheptulose 7-phosphate isomerase|nr:D-sedoheptulose 7-phosphate isomerase [Elusimicrobiota bacterium]
MPDFKKSIVSQLKDSAKVLTLTAKLAPEADAVAQALLKCYRNGGKLLTFGNGGSSCDAQNFADELVGRYRRNRPPLSALALTVNQGDLTSIANDFGYEEVFARQLRAHGRAGDVAVAISTSGNSKNVLKAIAAAKELGLAVVGLTGRTGGKMKSLCDHCLCVPSDSTARVQEAHITLIQIWCGILEDELFPDAPLAHN